MADTDGEIIPVRIVTARKQHACFECPNPIMPGDKYERHVMPPRRSEVWDVDRWHVAAIHYPRHRGGWFGLGCEEAAAYREQKAREAIHA